MMWPTLLLGLLVASVAGWIITAWFQIRRIRRLERSHEEIQVEETLVFDFLHGLGEAFRETIRPQELHRLIVEGATRVLDAHGGALYVTDRTGGKLTPAFISTGCPPLVDVPPNILQQAAAGPSGDGFVEADFVGFKRLAEQSAFAPDNALIYSMANETKRLDHDLEMARDIQLILLPSEAPAINGFQISGINAPARQVSGEYFDYIQVDQERLGVVIADVSGKGVPASLIMAICRSVLRAEAARNPSPADVF